jgi:hypothetical protein
MQVDEHLSRFMCMVQVCRIGKQMLEYHTTLMRAPCTPALISSGPSALLAQQHRTLKHCRSSPKADHQLPRHSWPCNVFQVSTAVLS